MALAYTSRTKRMCIQYINPHQISTKDTGYVCKSVYCWSVVRGVSFQANAAGLWYVGRRNVLIHDVGKRRHHIAANHNQTRLKLMYRSCRSCYSVQKCWKYHKDLVALGSTMITSFWIFVRMCMCLSWLGSSLCQKDHIWRAQCWYLVSAHFQELRHVLAL